MDRKPHTSWSLEKMYREQEKRKLIQALKPYPVAVTVSLEMDGVEFSAVVSGADAIRLFRRDPGTREAVRNLQPGLATPRITKVGRVSIVVAYGQSASAAKHTRLAKVEAAPFGTNPTTGKPFQSREEAVQWAKDNVDTVGPLVLEDLPFASEEDVRDVDAPLRDGLVKSIKRK